MGRRAVTRLLTALALVGSMLLASPAEAASTRITQGDARQVFEGVGQADVDARIAIRPFSGSIYDGRHYCAEDWHVILISLFEGGDASFTRRDAEAIFSGTVVSFALDGVALPTSRTKIKPFMNPERFGFEVAYFVNVGRIMSPADLSIGSHTVSYTETDPSGEIFQSSIEFFIDAPGTGACL